MTIGYIAVNKACGAVLFGAALYMRKLTLHLSTNPRILPFNPYDFKLIKDNRLTATQWVCQLYFIYYKYIENSSLRRTNKLFSVS